MRITVRLFAAAREAAGREKQVLELPPAATVADAREALLRSMPEALVAGAAFAVNQQFARPEQVLADGDELAILPPVSGG